MYLGSIFVVGGLIQLIPGFWRWSHDANIRMLSKTVGPTPVEDSVPAWRQVLATFQKRLVSREERERDSSSYRYRAGMIGLAAGATIIVCAVLR